MIRVAGVLVLVLMALAGCSGAADKLLEPFTGTKDEILPGTRESVLASNAPLDKAAAPKEAATDPIAIPAAVSNANWAQPGGVPSNAMHNLDLGMQLKKVFAVSAGAGSSGRATGCCRDRSWWAGASTSSIRKRMSAPSMPRMAPGSGAGRWPPRARTRRARLAAVSLPMATTSMPQPPLARWWRSTPRPAWVWRQKLGSPVRAAPTVADGKVFVVTVANEVAALNIGDGQPAWKHQGTGEQASLMAVSRPAVADGFVVVPSTSGELVALSAGQGISAWDESLAAADPTTSLANLNDIAGRPVIDNGVVFGIAHAGRLGAFKLSDGSEVWSQEIAGSQTPWVAGDYVFVLSNRATMAAVAKRNGRCAGRSICRTAEPGRGRWSAAAGCWWSARRGCWCRCRRRPASP